MLLDTSSGDRSPIASPLPASRSDYNTLDLEQILLRAPLIVEPLPELLPGLPSMCPFQPISHPCRIAPEFGAVSSRGYRDRPETIHRVSCHVLVHMMTIVRCRYWHHMGRQPGGSNRIFGTLRSASMITRRYGSNRRIDDLQIDKGLGALTALRGMVFISSPALAAETARSPGRT